MKTAFLSTKMLGALLFLLLLIAAAPESQAQTLQECKDNLETAKRLIKVQEGQIADRDEQLRNRIARGEALQEKIDALNNVIAELRKQIDLQAENNRTLRDSLQLQQTIMESRQQAITDRDILIKELVKANKRSALDKIVEALPSLASIIAVALTAGK